MKRRTAATPGWEKSVEIVRDILHQTDGDWTHEIDGQPVRFVKEWTAPSGVKIIYFRGKGYAGLMPKVDWLLKSKPIEEVKQR